MAAKKKPTEKVLERTYTVPLRKEYRKAPNWRRTKKAVTALKQFLTKHMKSDQIKLSKEINEKLWQHGIKNPPHKIKVTVTKDQEGIVKAELFGIKEKVPRKEKKKEEEKKTGKKEENKPKEKETPKKVEENTPEPVIEPKKEVKPHLQDRK